MKKFIFLLIALSGIECSDNGSPFLPLTDIPVKELQNAPDTITVEGKILFLTTFLWRDFQPISPPDGKPLIAILVVEAIDSAVLPHYIIADAVWIVHGQDVWKSRFTNEPVPPGEQRPNRIVEFARNGRKWGPGIYVSVVVRVLNSHGESFLLRASDQFIERTD